MAHTESHHLMCRQSRDIATGETKHIFLGPDMKPVKLPEKYFALFGIGTATV